MNQPIENAILAEIGQLTADLMDGDPEGAFTYAEAADMYQSVSLYRETAENVLYFEPSDELFGAIGRLWDAADESKKWRVFTFEITNGQFEAAFQYPDDLDPEEGSFERSERALEERYGDKPVIYPEPDDDMEIYE